MIPLFKPSMTELEFKYVKEIMATNYITLGPKTKEFEEKFCKWVGSPYGTGISSATIGLIIGLDILGVKDNDEVAVPGFTFVASVLAIIRNRAVPLYIDIEKDTLCMDPNDLEKKITSKTKAIMPVHYGGHPCDMDAIMDISKKKGIPIIEDCSHGPTSYYKGKHIGTFGEIGVFSFSAVKPLTSGDGGIAITNDEKIWKLFNQKRWFGANKDASFRGVNTYSWYYEVDTLGYKGYLNNIAAAIAMAQLERQEELHNKRRRVFELYNDAFKDLEWLDTPIEKEGCRSSIHNYACKLKEIEDRDKFVSYMIKNGISCGVHYYPIYLHHYEKLHNDNPNTPVTDDIWQRVALLPMFPDITDNEIEKVIKTVKEFKK